MKRIIFGLIITLFVSFITSGCVERKLIIKSNPPGANVYFNDTYVGKTPVDFDFEWYWTHNVKLEKEGYGIISNYETIKAPPYMWIPCDLVMELLPFKIRDYHTLTYTLEPLKQIESEEDEGKLSREEIDFND